jgi:hypothetical protein
MRLIASARQDGRGPDTGVTSDEICPTLVISVLPALGAPQVRHSRPLIPGGYLPREGGSAETESADLQVRSANPDSGQSASNPGSGTSETPASRGGFVLLGVLSDRMKASERLPSRNWT